MVKCLYEDLHLQEGWQMGMAERVCANTLPNQPSSSPVIPLIPNHLEVIKVVNQWLKTLLIQAENSKKE